MILQLNPPLEMVTPLGEAEAHFLESSGDRIYFGVFQKNTGENWWWENCNIRLGKCLTSGRCNLSSIKLTPDLEKALSEHLK